MPQMSPLSWAPLMALVSTALMLVSASLHWSQTKSPLKQAESLTLKNIYWKW